MIDRIRVDATTKKAIVLAIAALSVCAVGAILIVGRGSGSTGLQATQAGGPGVRGGGPGDSGSQGLAPPGGAPGTGADGGFARFRACLADHGVTLPEPGQGRRLAPDGELRTAFEACRRYLPARPFGPDGPRGDGDRGSDGSDGPTGHQTF